MKNPKLLRKGQFIFNFLEWLKSNKGLASNQVHKLADPFYISDEMWNKYMKEYKKYLKEIKRNES